MVVEAPIHCIDRNVVTRLGGLCNQCLDLAQACGVTTVFPGYVHHHQELATALIQRQHLELVAGRKHGRLHHGVANHGIEQFAPLHAFVLAIRRMVGGWGLKRGPAVTARHQRNGGVGVEQARRLHRLGFGRRLFGQKPAEQ